MSTNPNHHFAIHGHFYQPPRENPWLGVIEEQESAHPFRDWNSRICAECYTPLTCSPVSDHTQRTCDLFNCYAHISYNFGPTLISWLEKYAPFTLERLQVADSIARHSYSGSGSAMAQVYNHQILPLSDAADRHTQILWGIKEFWYRFRRQPSAIWLAETGVDMNTVRALIDHGIKYIILSPLQASYIRRFGEFSWTGVPDGTIDTRVPYRLFEVDGGGRTHFDRYLDVIFYDKEISTKVSFEHLLNDTSKMEWLIKERFSEQATLPQMVLIATDGEIYGHHEKDGNKRLAQLLHHLLNNGGCGVTNLDRFMNENQPSQEVKLWEGVDGKGSSWSCSHGVGRWHRDCGCSDGPHNFTQKWREHLRNAFDELRYHIRHICCEIGSELVYDFIDARNDYISVILECTEVSREHFIKRHAREELSERGKIKLWKILEADRNAMLMYTSCGWFFSDISGCESQQNMRYALRAAELANEFSDFNLITMLQERLKKAVSNYHEQGTGADIFKNHILNSRYSYKEITAIHALLSLYQLPLPDYNTKVQLSHLSAASNGSIKYIAGCAECFDKFTRQKEETAFFGFSINSTLECGVCFCTDIATAREMSNLTPDELIKLLKADGVALANLPYTERKVLNHLILKEKLAEADDNLHQCFNSHKPVFEHLTANRLPLPKHLKAIGEESLSHQLTICIQKAVNLGVVSMECKNEVYRIKAEAVKYGLTLNYTESSRLIAHKMSDKLIDLLSNLSEESVIQVLELLTFIQDNNFWLENWDELLDRFWRILHLPPREMPKSRAIVDNMRNIGKRLYFSEATLKHLTQILFSTPV